MTTQPINIRALGTEGRNSATTNIDLLPTLEMVKLLNDQNRVLADAVEEQAEQIAKAVDVITERMRQGGRLIYIGAGTSGRMGVLDASEVPPTFSVAAEKVVGLIAGGEPAIRSTAEGAEDDLQGGVAQLKELGLTKDDVLVAIAASGRTPYAIGALDYAHDLGAATISVVNNKNSEMGKHSDIAIEVAVGPEALTGSTRLKSGTAQKLVINILSTATMIQQGKTYGNLMVDVKASNAKLYARSLNILRELFPDLPAEKREEVLQAADGSVKLAAVMLAKSIPAQEARAELERNQGSLRRVFGEA